MTDPIEPISAQQAREILEKTIRDTLGDEWDDEEDGWMLVTGHDYMARLTRGGTNIDFYVDLLGHVTIQKSELSGAQLTGRMFAIILLCLSIVIALLIVRIASGS